MLATEHKPGIHQCVLAFGNDNEEENQDKILMHACVCGKWLLANEQSKQNYGRVTNQFWPIFHSFFNQLLRPISMLVARLKTLPIANNIEQPRIIMKQQELISSMKRMVIKKNGHNIDGDDDGRRGGGTGGGDDYFVGCRCFLLFIFCFFLSLSFSLQS